MDDLRLVPVLRKAAELKVPVMVHSYPWGPGFYDCCLPERVARMAAVFPDVTFITAHMGGMRWQDALRCAGYADISAALFDLVDLYGIIEPNGL